MTILRHTTFATYVVSLCFICNLIIEVGDYLIRAPFMRTLESGLCRQYWNEHDPSRFSSGEIDEKWCKVGSVQAQLSMLKGWDSLFSCVSTMLLTVPMGIVADRFGRRKLLSTSLVGLSIATAWMQMIVYFDAVFDVRWFWAGNLFLLIGGGPAVINNVFYIIIADVITEDERATAFFRFMATNLLGTLLGVPSAWWLARYNIYTPMLLGLGFIFMGTAISFFMPETLVKNVHGDPVTQPLLQSSRPNEEPSGVEDSRIGDSTLTTPIAGSARLFPNISFITTSPTLLLLLPTFFANSLGSKVQTLLLQFVSIRYSLYLSTASLLMPATASINFVVLMFVLPSFTKFFASDEESPNSLSRDLKTARFSIICLTVGVTCVSFSPNIIVLLVALVIYAFGAGYTGASRSVVTSFAGKEDMGKLYAILGIIDTIGSLIAGPSLSRLFNWGLEMGGMWSGIPFLFAGVLFGLVGVVFWSIKIRSERISSA